MDHEVTAQMRAALAESQIRRGVVAKAMGCNASILSRYLNNQLRMPEGFPGRFSKTLEQLIAQRRQEQISCEKQRRQEQTLRERRILADLKKLARAR